jgi:hypothetical protein
MKKRDFARKILEVRKDIEFFLREYLFNQDITKENLVATLDFPEYHPISNRETPLEYEVKITFRPNPNKPVVYLCQPKIK